MLGILFIAGYLAFGIYAIRRYLLEKNLFEISTDNPYRRKCKKCGARQELYESNVEGWDHVWWEEAGMKEPAPNCPCRKFVESH